MYLNSIIEYINRGLIVKPLPKQYRKLVLSSGFFTLLGLLCGMVSAKPGVSISIFMMLILVISAVLTFKFSLKELTAKRRLIIQAIITVCWILQILLLQTIIFTTEYGWHIGLVLLYLPTVLIPSVLGIITSQQLKMGSVSSTKKSAATSAVSGITAAVVGWGVGHIFRDVSDNTATLVIIISFTIVNALLSIGLLDIQRIYYLFKYEKRGLLSGDGDKGTVLCVGGH